MKIFQNSVLGLVSIVLMAAFSFAPSQPANWEAIPGNCDDIAVGAEGSVFCVAPGGDGAVFKWSEDAFSWSNVGGKADRIAVDAAGIPWVLTKDKKVFRLRGSVWQSMPGEAVDIGAGADGSLWAIGEGGKVYTWNDDGFAWEDRGGNADKITVNEAGVPWVVTKENKIFRLRGATWQAMPGDARDISAGADGSIWCISPAGKAYRWNDEGFAWMDEGGQDLRAIAVDPSGHAWVVTKDAKIYYSR